MDLSIMTKFDEWYLRFGGNGAMMQLSSVRRKAHGLLSFLKYSLQGTTQGNGLTGADMPVRFSM